MTLQKNLVIFARAPRMGRVKRRLAKDLGPVAALRFHRLTTAGLLRRLARSPYWTTWLAVTPDREAGNPRGLWPTPARRLAQGRGDLGDRMGRAFQRLPPGPVVIVGADIPDISAHHVAQAFRALGRHDWVLGPASDGGYWLIGARRRPRLTLPFKQVRWGGSHSRADTLAGLKGQSVALLEELDDVDTAVDLARRRSGG